MHDNRKENSELFHDKCSELFFSFVCEFYFIVKIK